MKFDGAERGGQRRVDVTDNENGSGPDRDEMGLETGQDSCRLFGMCARTNLELKVRSRKSEISEEHLGQPRIVVLSCVYKERLQDGRAHERTMDGSHLHEVRTCRGD